ncbi:thiamine pyrophosphate-dependent enzyme [Kangiella sediminilitoris]|uniref:3-methyl-2-oxobutanoate dehydrogenase (2-methylpropanoyl-transferring) n=1 Tax=Kangiella sediminilitoris TaxID=1144748 RepID=A0A1B3B9G2_9GAMM|nr:thiamine pyrophosphate-dependent enzyme [Kangiella sediminilitoris]AOE49443.1 MFS transporter [Kangiella sediminilitoris]
MLDRASVIDQNFLIALKTAKFPNKVSNIQAGVTQLSPQEFVQLFESQIISRHLDLRARILKDQGIGFYTIGSSGHEGNATLGKVFRHTDMAFLHYRSGALMAERSRKVHNVDPIRDQILSLVAAKDDPISQGRHKVFGSTKLFVPPQTSTIASHLPKAMGAAWSLGKAQRTGFEADIPSDSVILCNFGDASFNHATSQSAFNAAQYIAYKGEPLPLVYICEDNGIGISVSTPDNWIENNVKNRQSIEYIQCNGLHLPDAYLAAQEAEEIARYERRPVFLHMKTIRLMGHAGNDTESMYHSIEHIESTEAQDPLLHSARLAIEAGYMTTDDILNLYENTRQKVEKTAEAAIKLPKLSSAEEVCASIAPERPAKEMPALPTLSKRHELFDIGRQFKFLDKPRSMAQLINYALTDLMEQYPNIMMFGEDVGKKGGVYSVSTNLQKRFSDNRVFDTMLDETSILGNAIGAAHLGYLPIPEIQFLAYTHNAVDQIRGEASTLSFFSNNQFTNPMVIRIAGLAYQKGFGGHFHNDNSMAFLREIPGIIIACPSHGQDAAKMLREAVRLADEQKRVVIFLEPIALYHAKDLHTAGDNGWLGVYPEPHEIAPFGEPALYPGEGKKKSKTLVISYGNGHYLSQQAQKILRDKYKTPVDVMDIRWLAPLNHKAIAEAAENYENILVVDECRKTGSLSEELITGLIEHMDKPPKIKRITGHDTFIPIGTSWQYVLPSKDNIVAAALELKD